jgi:hypothetical protein
VLEAVAAVACRAVVGGHARRCDECFACVFEALLIVGVERGFGRERGGGVLGGAATGPGAFFGAFVCKFGAVVEAVGSNNMLVWWGSWELGESTLCSSHSGRAGSRGRGSIPSGSARLWLQGRGPPSR